VSDRTNFIGILSTFLIAGTLLSITASNSYGITGVSGYEYGYGPISSINNDWVLAGHWMGYYNPSNLTDSGFHSTFDMVLKNGSAPHMHQITNATVNDVQKQGNDTVIKGVVTITMKDGPVSNVPITWTEYSNNTLGMVLDPSMINNHFGESPIYGLILSPEKEMKTMNAMMEDSKFMDKWIPLMMENVMRNINLGNGNGNGNMTIQLDGGNMTSMPMMNQTENQTQ
jgi:hypothetical protein